MISGNINRVQTSLADKYMDRTARPTSLLGAGSYLQDRTKNPNTEKKKKMHMCKKNS